LEGSFIVFALAFAAFMEKAVNNGQGPELSKLAAQSKVRHFTPAYHPAL
jgi:hypothetical protein